MKPNPIRAIGCLVLICLLAGCARYQITLSNNNTITTRGRPKLNKEKTAYEFKDARGRTNSVPVFRVKEIAPL
jgi:uncharacterized lipoprotein YajG